MPIDNINLSKLLKLLFSEGQPRITYLRTEIRSDLARARGETDGGGDFYVPFWADARDHVCGIADLHQSTTDRIERNERRQRLYPLLRDGFLLWWDQRRRWTNEPFRQGEGTSGTFEVIDPAITIKVKGLLVVEDGLGEEHIIYPYFSEAPVLSADASRLGLWIIQNALRDVEIDAVRILDVQRGETTSIERTPLTGNEQQELAQRYRLLQRDYDELVEGYQ